jgi:hypothetical protein
MTGSFSISFTAAAKCPKAASLTSKGISRTLLGSTVPGISPEDGSQCACVPGGFVADLVMPLTPLRLAGVLNQREEYGQFHGGRC